MIMFELSLKNFKIYFDTKLTSTVNKKKIRVLIKKFTVFYQNTNLKLALLQTTIYLALLVLESEPDIWFISVLPKLKALFYKYTWMYNKSLRNKKAYYSSNFWTRYQIPLIDLKKNLKRISCTCIKNFAFKNV